MGGKRIPEKEGSTALGGSLPGETMPSEREQKANEQRVQEAMGSCIHLLECKLHEGGNFHYFARSCVPSAQSCAQHIVGIQKY